MTDKLTESEIRRACELADGFSVNPEGVLRCFEDDPPCDYFGGTLYDKPKKWFLDALAAELARHWEEQVGSEYFGWVGNSVHTIRAILQFQDSGGFD